MNIHRNWFVDKSWQIFHGAYKNEPFGYSIFDAVNYGKLPILHKDWGIECNYDYRVETKEDFDELINELIEIPYEHKLLEFNKLRVYLQQFSSLKKWVENVGNIIKKS
jgi:hypothetical protein